MTIVWWVIALIILIGGIVLALCAFYGRENKLGIRITVFAIVIFLGLVAGGHWYCNNTANGVRAMKDQESNLHGGLYRQVIVLAADGREVYSYEGCIDIETKPKNNYILFETEEGQRHMIYYSVTDTVLILEQ